MRLLPLVFLSSLLCGFVARAADISDCDDDYSECREDCTMQYGSKSATKKKFGKCAVKCEKKLNDCRERHLETKRNNLDEGSIAKSPSSRQSDEEDLRHADSAPAKQAADDDDEKPKKNKKSSGDDAPPPKTNDDEVVKSNRTRVSDPPPPKEDPAPAKKKTDDSKAQSKSDDPPPSKKKDDPPPAKSDPPPRAEEPKSKSGLDSDVRSEDEKPKKKSDDKPKDDGKKRKALDEWDPEAL
ncbi:MAG: hypothetical protein QM723_30420 [Myxococcaceae bacterium]